MKHGPFIDSHALRHTVPEIFLENEPHVREIQLTTTARNISIVWRVCQFDEEGNQRYPGDVFEVLTIVWGKDCPNQYLCILELWLFNVST
jgi:hypothetical protein